MVGFKCTSLMIILRSLYNGCIKFKLKKIILSEVGSYELYYEPVYNLSIPSIGIVKYLGLNLKKS